MALDPVETPAKTLFCSDCGGAYQVQDLARFGDQFICLNCKPGYLQRLREGIQPLGASLTAVHYGGFWIRVLAVIIDGLIMSVITVPVGLIFGVGVTGGVIGRGESLDSAALVAKMMLLLMTLAVDMALSLAYHVYFVSQKGGTPGKLALGLRIVNASDHKNLSVAKAVARYFAQAISSIILCIGYIMAAFDVEKRALHDYICDTRVIYK